MKFDRFDAAACIGLLVLTVAIYAPTSEFDFIGFDDDRYVTENPLVLNGLDWESAGRAFTRFRASNWHPLTWISHMADVSLFGLDGGAHHAVNVGLHALASCLLFLVLRRMTAPAGPGRDRRYAALSAVVAAVFVAHPAHVESVAWISERKDLLCAVFWMLTLGAYLGYARAPSPGRFALVALGLLAALLSKPMAVSLPLVLLLLDYWPLGRWARSPVRGPAAPVSAGRLILEKLPLLAIVAASSAVTLFAQDIGRAVQSIERIPIDERVANALLSYDRYLGIAAWPTDLSLFYPRVAPEVFTPLFIGLTLVPLVVLSAWAVREWRRRPFLAVGWLWFLVTLVPVIGLVQVGEQSIADRYTYLPYVGLSIAVAWGVESYWPQHPRRSGALVGLAAAAIAACAILASSQVATWQSPETIWRQSLASHERNAMAHSQLGHILLQRGDRAGAQIHAEQAIADNPSMLYPRYQLAVIFAETGQPEAARSALADALALDPRMAEAIALRADLDRREGQWMRAITGFEEALALDRRLRRSAPVTDGLARALRAQYEEARRSGTGLEDARQHYLRIRSAYPRLDRVARDFRELEANPVLPAAP